MKPPPLNQDVADLAPDGAELTAYDEEHVVTYVRMLDADTEEADWRGLFWANIVADPSFELDNGSWTFSDIMSVQNVGTFARTGSLVAFGNCSGGDCVNDPISGAYFKQSLNTVASQTYMLTFWVAETGGATSEVTVWWGGAEVADFVNPANNTLLSHNWQELTVTGLVATDPSTVLQIYGRQDQGGIFFDDFSVDIAAAVPEPSTWAMMLLGFLGVGFLAYRKKSTLRLA
jgi:hypothetical protein